MVCAHKSVNTPSGMTDTKQCLATYLAHTRHAQHTTHRRLGYTLSPVVLVQELIKHATVTDESW